MGYPTADDLVAASSGDAQEALQALDDPQLDALRTGAIKAVESWTSQSFEAEGAVDDPVLKLIDGNGADSLYLPKRLASITALAVEGQGYDLADVSLDSDGAYIAWVDPLNAGSWVTRVRRQPGDPGPRWPVGRDNVGVSGVWGWTDDEWAAGRLDAVATAIRFDMEDQALADANKLASTIRTYRSLGLTQISQGGLSATIGAADLGLSLRAQRMLIDLRWDLPVAAVA